MDTIGYNGIYLKDLQPPSGTYKEKIEKLKFYHAWHGLGTHGGGWGKAKCDKCDKSGALQGGDRASSGIAFLGPSRAPFRILLLAGEGSKQTHCRSYGVAGYGVEWD